MIDSRLNVFKPLLKLSGRLDLVLAQVAIRGAGYSKTKPASIPRQAFIAGLCCLRFLISFCRCHGSGVCVQSSRRRDRL